MKIRNGFVSNSSTSCFIVYGVKVEENFEEIQTEGTSLSLSSMGNDNARIHIVGQSIGSFEYFEISDLNIDGLVKAREELLKLFPNEKPKLYSNVSAD